MISAITIELWAIDHPQRTTVVQLVRNIPVFYTTRGFRMSDVCEVVEWIHLALDILKTQAVVNTVMNSRFP
jgi:hypothetical protein